MQKCACSCCVRSTSNPSWTSENTHNTYTYLVLVRVSALWVLVWFLGVVAISVLWRGSLLLLSGRRWRVRGGRDRWLRLLRRCWLRSGCGLWHRCDWRGCGVLCLLCVFSAWRLWLRALTLAAFAAVLGGLKKNIYHLIKGLTPIIACDMNIEWMFVFGLQKDQRRNIKDQMIYLYKADYSRGELTLLSASFWPASRPAVVYRRSSRFTSALKYKQKNRKH